ncbi:hypothetical protein E0E50_01510 [Azotobacter chroococcum subsp. isscasi]|uniref:hypothetical protein n=1 Tax=Azotobacter chroococcum TaxID=353 RepID=UPI0010387920|nr:hypothetical protein [Azotobacter chroococcum]TBW12973.1 hypothetical protein E0E50_01510 [Azotobacter chroococcum subsp. isscasi]
MKHVVVHIDHLVLKGFRPEDRHAIAAGLQQELVRVFADGEAVSLLQARGDMPRLRVSGVPVEPAAKPQRVGQSAAQGIGKEIVK